ncbi:DUF4142 domain-containing protein [Pedobacter jejuensis]|uniref:DUF4142 domain-containing protein n=1 Tax=Pedobacter jejuensis TaxID=1268550 RepID=A0A3N0BTM5_9SPHI|nr:DUF4142 domain-containing protein [Pedobacter jejuensis]RNL52449.1 DUF4142 domain-containing protein [Pedobacter jejuensis]
MKKIFLGLALSAIVTFQACQSADKKSSTMKDSVAGDTTMVNGNHVVGAESTETSLDDDGNTFLKKAAVGGIMEVEAAKIALKNAKSADVKSFAQQMLTDHTKSNTELKELAIAKKVITPDALPAEDQIHLDEMKKMTGSNFDKHYVDMMITDHEKTVKLFELGKQNKDSDLKKWASNTLTIIEGHTAKAKELASVIK